VRQGQWKWLAPVLQVPLVDQSGQPAFVEPGRIAFQAHALEFTRLGIKHLAQKPQRQRTIARVQFSLAVGGNAAKLAALGQVIACIGQRLVVVPKICL